MKCNSRVPNGKPPEGLGKTSCLTLGEFCEAQTFQGKRRVCPKTYRKLNYPELVSQVMLFVGGAILEVKRWKSLGTSLCVNTSLEPWPSKEHQQAAKSPKNQDLVWAFSGVFKRAASKRLVLADVPLYQNFLQKSLPAVLPWQKKTMFFDIPGPQKLERGHIRQNRLLQDPPFCFLSTHKLPPSYVAPPPLRSDVGLRLTWEREPWSPKSLTTCCELRSK